jgi:hypothetical protein
MGTEVTMKFHQSRGHRRAAALGCAIAAVAFVGPASAAGNGLQLTVPKHASVGVPYSVTISGNAVKAERLYIFLDYHKCGATPADEHQRTSGNYWTVHGGFTRTSSGWTSSRRGKDHACAYLAKLSEPLNSPSGVLAHAFAGYQIH